MPIEPADDSMPFDDQLRRFAETAPIPRLSPMIDGIRRPVGVAVVGRPGVGRDTVSCALRGCGIDIAADGAASDVRVLVIAEAIKPEERAMAATAQPTLIVLNKADLTGSRPGGALPNAYRRAADVQRRTGRPTVAMVGLLATPMTLDGELVDALRTLVNTPADLGCVDAFCTGEHPIGVDVRTRLLERLDRFGIAHAVLALADGTDPTALPAHLRSLSNLDAVVAGLRAVAAPVRYRRHCLALAEMHSLAIQLDDARLLRLLNSDAAVLATMAAAVDVVEADGIRVDPGDHPDAHLRRAVQWRRYGRGPVDALHRSCGAAITRGSLRLLGRGT